MGYISKIMIILAVGGLVLPYFSFAQTAPAQPAPGLGLTPPQTMEEAQQIGMRALGFLPQTLQEVWQGFLGYCLSLVNIFVKIWNDYIFPYLNNIWQSSLKQEVQKRTPVIQQEFQVKKTQTTQEIKTAVPKVTKTLWQKFMELIK
jgi:hypothetical protein